MRTQRARRVALFAYCCAIFLLSARHGYPEAEKLYPLWMPDPGLIAHFFIYFGLGLTAWNAFRAEKSEWLRRNAAAAAVVFSAFYGLTDEIHQLFVEGRNFEIRDLVMNTVGGAAAVYYALRRARRRANQALSNRQQNP